MSAILTQNVPDIYILPHVRHTACTTARQHEPLAAFHRKRPPANLLPIVSALSWNAARGAATAQERAGMLRLARLGQTVRRPTPSLTRHATSAAIY